VFCFDHIRHGFEKKEIDENGGMFLCFLPQFITTFSFAAEKKIRFVVAVVIVAGND